MDELTSDFDTAWKQALEWFFEPFLAFFFPEVHVAVDWSREPQFLDKELQKIVPEAEVGRGTVDILVSVWLIDGTEEWMLIHVEVQSQYDAKFPERMYIYNHRLSDRYGRMPVSLAILGDENNEWRPDSYQNGKMGCDIHFTFPIAKLIDYKSRESELIFETNPFSAVTLSHLKALETRGDAKSRYSGKLALIKSLYDRGLDRERVLRLFRLMDWMLKLPAVLDSRLVEEIEMYEKEKQMPLLSPIEQMWHDDALAKGLEQGRLEGKQEGRQEGLVEGNQLGLLKGIEAVLAVRFGKEGEKLMPQVRQINDLGVIIDFLNATKTAPDLAALLKMYPSLS